MKPVFAKFPSIDQFRTVIKRIVSGTDYHNKTEEGYKAYPKLKFKGTVKSHGTNGGVIQAPSGEVWVQSRRRVIDIGTDNAGFAFGVQNVIGWDIFGKLFEYIRTYYKQAMGKHIGIYGEWAGPGVQSGVGLSGIDEKVFIVFAARLFEMDSDGNIDPTTCEWVELEFGGPVHKNLYHVNDFITYEMEIDFDKPTLVQNDLIKLTNAVEESCPIAKALGSEGIGEGIVWKPVDSEYNDAQYWFKVKGEKHSESKVKTLAEVDPEKVKGINEFVDFAVTEQRLQKGIDFLNDSGFEVSRKSTGEFLKWFVSDIVREEGDTLTASSIEPKDVNKAISIKARNWYFEQIV